jgi:hypothetical protein
MLESRGRQFPNAHEDEIEGSPRGRRRRAVQHLLMNMTAVLKILDGCEKREWDAMTITQL